MDLQNMGHSSNNLCFIDILYNIRHGCHPEATTLPPPFLGCQSTRNPGIHKCLPAGHTMVQSDTRMTALMEKLWVPKLCAQEGVGRGGAGRGGVCERGPNIVLIRNPPDRHPGVNEASILSYRTSQCKQEHCTWLH